MAYITPDGTIIETGGSSVFPTAQDFSGPVGGDVSDLSLVPDLDASTPAYWQSFGPGLGLPETATGPSRGQRQAGAFSTPWILIGGLGLIWIVMRRK